jgi:hypothetical protein
MADIFSKLAAAGPSPEIEEGRQLFAPLIGSWELESTWYEHDGSKRHGNGEWHFDWILGGRGVQDVIFMKEAPADEYGTTIRCYDAGLDAWYVSFMQPAGREFVSLVARKSGDHIVQEGRVLDDSSLERWTFSDISAEGFRWRGESSRDHGTTWRLDQELTATRRHSRFESGV